MKNTLKTLLIASVLVLPVSAYAGHQEHNEEKVESIKMYATGEKCPIANQMGDMQTKMGGMMDKMKDPAMKEKMQKMHGDMGGMMQHMQQMHEQTGEMPGMMGDKGNNPEHDEHKH